jgi:hypothetical protein
MRINLLAWKILTTPCCSMGGMVTQNRCSFEFLEMAHASLLGMAE